MNIDMLGLIWHHWKWIFECPLLQYDSKKLYLLLHQHHEFSPILNARWVCFDVDKWWIKRLHSVWYVQVSYKLHVFACLVIYQGISTKERLVRSGILDAIFPLCLKMETVKSLFWDCPFARSCWKIVQIEALAFFHGKLHWRESLLGDCNYLVHHSRQRVWHCMRLVALFIVWNIRCKYVFDNESSSMTSFSKLWKEEVCL